MVVLTFDDDKRLTFVLGSEKQHIAFRGEAFDGRQRDLRQFSRACLAFHREQLRNLLQCGIGPFDVEFDIAQDHFSSAGIRDNLTSVHEIDAYDRCMRSVRTSGA